MNTTVLQTNDLNISFGKQNVVNKISFCLNQGRTLALVGESGSGKSVTAMGLLGLLPKVASVTGEVLFMEQNLLEIPPRCLRSIRGNKIAMVFQEPMSSLNPVFTIGEQIEESALLHLKLSKKSARLATHKIMEEVGLNQSRFNAYPHEFSGGMRQRVMIAMALIGEPEILIADEPTTALDATTSRQIMDLLSECKKRRNMSMLFISHDLHLVSSIADDVCVMHNGEIVESGFAFDVLNKPAHTYTQELLACTPSISRA